MRRSFRSRRGYWLTFVAYLLCLSACGDDGGSRDSGDTSSDAFVLPGACVGLNARSDMPLCLDRLDTQGALQSVAVRVGPAQSVAKFVMPARPDVELPAVAFIATQRFMLHVDFLKAAFPDVYGGIVGADYPGLFLEEERAFVAGHISEDEGRYSFTVVENEGVPASLLTRDMAIEVWSHLSARFGLGSLSLLTFSDRQRDAAMTWSDSPFEIEGVDADYQAYNTGRGAATFGA